MKRTYNFLLALLLAFGGLIVPDASLAQATAERSTAGALRNASPALPLTLPNRKDSVKFLAIGDTGTGSKQQNELARVMVDYRQVFPYEFAILMGDNMYGAEKAKDFKFKFEDVYKPLIDGGVKFYATLGNHDENNQRFYENFNMEGEEYYRFEKNGVAFYSLNSNYMDKRQIKWLHDKMSSDKAKWKIAYFHHPLYASGKHGSSTDLRELIEPIFFKYGVDVVFVGHEHFYERIKPQNGIQHFVTGAGGKLRKGDVDKNSPLTAKAFDQDLSFMLIEVTGDEMHFQVISRTGETVDSGVIKRRAR